MGITIQSNSTLTVMIHLITLGASWFNVFWFTSLVLDFGLLLLLYSSCVFHHYQQRSTENCTSLYPPDMSSSFEQSLTHGLEGLDLSQGLPKGESYRKN